LIDRLGVQEYYVPLALGGRLVDFVELAAALRVIARRDLSVAIAHNITFAGAAHVWAAGSPDQKRFIASYVKAGGRMAIVYHEEAHGSDLLSTQTTAACAPAGYVLDGEKWFINNGTVADVHTVFARTTPAGGARGFSLFLVDKRALRPASFEHLPRVRTLGARGVDFSGVRFRGAELPEGALIGRVGEGLELTLRSFQVTRSLIPSISLGAADTALRTVLSFSLRRELRGKPVFSIARPRALLVGAFADLLACDCVLIGTMRALQVATDQMRLWSALCKVFVPSTVHQVLDVLGDVLGARSFVRDDAEFGSFQKILRDHRAVPMFHAGGFMLLQTIAMGLVEMSAARDRSERPRSPEWEATLESIFTVARPLPPFEWTALRAYARPRDPLVVFDLVRDQLRGPDALEGVDPEVAQAVDAFVDVLQNLRRKDAQIMAQQRSVIDAEAPEIFDLAERYCAMHAAAACLQVWALNRRVMDPFFAGGHWLAVCLSRILERLHVVLPVSEACRERVARHLAQLHVERRSFSILPWKLAGPVALA
jgi:alkylation response protein AidB-like acyl-CoA dehydrogenase